MNLTRTFALIAFSAAALACSSEQKAQPTTSTPSATPAPAPTPSAEPAPSATASPGKPRRKEGEMCGGIAGLRCEDGLECVIPEPMHPDKAGKCTKR